MVNEQDFEDIKAALDISVGTESAKAITKLTGSISAKKKKQKWHHPHSSRN